MLSSNNVFKFFLISLFAVVTSFVFGNEATGDVVSNVTESGISLGLIFGVLGAGLATLLGGVGSSIGLGYSGQAASGALSEDPEKFGSIFPIQALPGSQGIFGLLVGFLILVKIGVLGQASTEMTLERGLYAMMCSLPVGIVGVSSGIWMGRACAASIQLVSRKPGEFGKAIISPALIETYAVFGLLMSFMMWLKL